MTETKSQSATKDESFEKLLQDVLEHPERICDESITEEQVLKLQKRISPYSYVADSAGPTDDFRRTAAVSYTNLREDWIRRFTMTSLVGFLFQVYDEWNPTIEKRRWKPKRKKQSLHSNETRPFTTDELLARARSMVKKAESLKEAEEQAQELETAAEQAETRYTALALESKEAEKLQKAKTKARILRQKVNLAAGKVQGLNYEATRSLYRYGREADRRFDSALAGAKKHPEIAQIIARDPVEKERIPIGELEVPEDVAKGLIGEFLRNWFEFNPNAHVRGAHDEVALTTEKDPATGKDRQVDAIDPERLPLEVLRAKPPNSASPEDADALKVMCAVQISYNAACTVLRNESLGKALLHALRSDDARESFRRYLFPIPEDSKARPAVDVIPPQDSFHRWGYYTEVNYDALRSATEAIYCEKPDLDWALILYEYQEGSTEEVDKWFASFRDKHQDEVISSIRALDFGGWTLLGDFKENRSRISFLNKHTEVLRRILDRHEEDKRIGKELMKHRVRRLKAQNIREEGPDAPGLKEYRAQNTKLGSMGAERVITPAEMKRLEKARGDLSLAKELEVLDQYKATIVELETAAKARKLLPEEQRQLADAKDSLKMAEEMLHVPEDAIQVDVFTHDAKAGTLQKTKFYTEAEAPDPECAEDMRKLHTAKDRPLAPHALQTLEEELRRKSGAPRAPQS